MKNKELILEIVNLCLLINAETDFAAFFGISGHVDTISVSVCESKEIYKNILIDFQSIKTDNFTQLLKVYVGLKKYHNHD